MKHFLEPFRTQQFSLQWLINGFDQGSLRNHLMIPVIEVLESHHVQTDAAQNAERKPNQLKPQRKHHSLIFLLYGTGTMWLVLVAALTLCDEASFDMNEIQITESESKYES